MAGLIDGPPTPAQMHAVELIAPQVRRARHAILRDMKRPGVLQVSPQIFDILCPDGPVFVYAVPFPRFMGLDIHPNPDLRGDQIAVTERM